jgi:hypothetical protein
MTVLPTAKILLFIALNLGPHNPPVVYATSSSESYIWSSSSAGWTVEGLGFPSSDFTRDPAETVSFSDNPTTDSVPHYLRAISHYHWRDNTMMVFNNGDRIEKHGNYALYIINAGGANEKVFTIMFPPPVNS